MSRRSKALAIVAAGLASATLFTACGSSGAGPGSASAGAGGSSAGAGGDGTGSTGASVVTAGGGIRSQRTMISSGETRSFVVYRGANAPRHGAPLVIAIPPAGSSGAGMESLTGFDAIADSHGFEVVYPDAVNLPGTSAGSWRIGCCSAWGDSPTDVVFFSNLIGLLARTDHINTRRVYVVGFSVGAAMAYRLACQLSSKIAAIGSVGGFEYLTIPCAPDRPVTVYEIHGTNDYYHGSCGGPTQSDAACPNNFGQPGYEPSVSQVNEQWRRLDRCPAQGVQQTSGAVTAQIWNRCAAGAGVRLDTIQNGIHCYPNVGATTCASFDASLQFWDFFAGRRLAPSPVLRPHPHTCVVPNLRGLALQVAQQRLAEEGCQLGQVARPNHVPAGQTLTVMHQSRPPGARRPRGATVNIDLGFPPPPKYH